MQKQDISSFTVSKRKRKKTLPTQGMFPTLKILFHQLLKIIGKVQFPISA
jgi:hypothetical protein